MTERDTEAMLRRIRDGWRLFFGAYYDVAGDPSPRGLTIVRKDGEVSVCCVGMETPGGELNPHRIPEGTLVEITLEAVQGGRGLILRCEEKDI